MVGDVYCPAVTPEPDKPISVAGSVALSSTVNGAKIFRPGRCACFVPAEPTWEAAADVEGSADEAIADFYQKHPNAPRCLPIPAQHFRPIFQHTEPDRSNGWSGRPTLRGG